MTGRQYALCTRHLKGVAYLEHYEDVSKVSLALDTYQRQLDEQEALLNQMKKASTR